MAVELNHTIVSARDKHRSAEFVGRLLGIEPSPEFGPFVPLTLANGATLDYANAPDGAQITVQHYAFLVSEADFDEIFGRIQAAGLPIWADPYGTRPGEINHNDGGRGVYFRDPDGHILEIFTRPYGSGSA
ncbi:VOC family protein [Streptomyces sp. 12297]|uniref:VOC family protein n=1 Tax=Streptomyces sp. NBC_00239 TaxID=2903640 RepID=UPI002E2E66F8|nr:VOC family protein [Streptomyces sp. NBC_00239]